MISPTEPLSKLKGVDLMLNGVYYKNSSLSLDILSMLKEFSSAIVSR